MGVPVLCEDSEGKQCLSVPEGNITIVRMYTEAHNPHPYNLLPEGEGAQSREE